MVNELTLLGFVLISRLALFVHGINVGNTSNTVTAKAPIKCLQQLDDARIYDSLKSEQNYYRISRAIYPSVDVPSLYVKITVQFLSGSANGSFVKETRKYTWSKACLYVATKYVSLYAMNVYSLGAIWPNKRERELFISLPEFCSNVTEEERKSKMIYFLSTLEDVTIIPKVQDPRLNTVQCVVEGHDGFNEDTFVGARKYLMHLYWCNLIFSFIIGFVAARVTAAGLTTAFKKEYEEDFYLLSVLHSFVELLLSITALIMAVKWGQGGRCYPILYSILVVAFFAIDIVNCCIRSSDNDTTRKTRIELVFTLGIHMIFHHFAWIILGIVTDPGWATIILFSYCSVLFVIYVFLYYSYKELNGVHQFDALFFGIFLISYLWFLFGIALSGLSFLSTDPVAGIISTVLAVVASLLWRYYMKSLND